jgi:hypothetical protein
MLLTIVRTIQILTEISHLTCSISLTSCSLRIFNEVPGTRLCVTPHLQLTSERRGWYAPYDEAQWKDAFVRDVCFNVAQFSALVYVRNFIVKLSLSLTHSLSLSPSYRYFPQRFMVTSLWFSPKASPVTCVTSTAGSSNAPPWLAVLRTSELPFISVFHCPNLGELSISSLHSLNLIYTTHETILSALSICHVVLIDQGVGVRVPVGPKIFTLPCRPDRLWGPPTLLSDGYRCSLPPSPPVGK